MRTDWRLWLVSLIVMLGITGCANTDSAQTTVVPGQEPTPTIDWRARQVLTLSGTGDMATPAYEGVDAITSDGESIRIDFSLIYYVSPTIIQNIQPDHWEQYIVETVTPIVRDSILQVVSGYAARETIYQRIDMQDHLQTELEKNLSNSKLIVVDLLVRDMQFSREFIAKIEQEVIATLTAEAQLPTSTPKGNVDPDR